MHFYQRLRDLREDIEPRMSQEKIAKVLGTTQKQYSRWETGESELPAHLFIELAKFYNVSADYILGLTNDKRKYW